MSDRQVWRSLRSGRLVAKLTDTGAVVLLFGKHEGCELTEVPASYLHWIMHAAHLVPEDLRAIAARMLPDEEGREIAEALEAQREWRANGHGYPVATKTGNGPIILRFGKHDGTAIERVPDRYIQWMLSRGFAPQDLAEVLEAELRRRGADVPHDERPDLPDATALVAWARRAPAGEAEALRAQLRELHDRVEVALQRRADEFCREIYG